MARTRTVHPVDMVAHFGRTSRKTLPGTPDITSTSTGTQSIATVPISPIARHVDNKRQPRGSLHHP